jgi:hypothetical protein
MRRATLNSTSASTRSQSARFSFNISALKSLHRANANVVPKEYLHQFGSEWHQTVTALETNP